MVYILLVCKTSIANQDVAEECKQQRLKAEKSLISGILGANKHINHFQNHQVLQHKHFKKIAIYCTSQCVVI